MGKPDALDRVAQALVGLVALVAIANGLFERGLGLAQSCAIKKLHV